MTTCRQAGSALLAIAIAIVTGCSPKNAEPTQQVVTLAGWQSNLSEQKLLARLLKQFETTHPDIKVKYEVITAEYMPVIYTRLAGGTAPDVFYLDAAEAPRLMNEGALEPLNPYIQKNFDLADFEKVLLDAFKKDGKIYGIPKDFSTLALFYNKKAFQQAGLAKPPQTWQDLFNDSKKLTRDKNKDGKIEQYGFGVLPELARQAFLIKSCGGQLTEANGKAAFATPAGLKGLQFLTEQYRNQRTSALPSDVGASSGSEMFGAGKAAMVIEGMWAIPYLKDTFPTLDFGIAPIPTICNKQGTMAYTVAYVLNKDAKHKTAAWQVISYLTGKAGMKAWTNTGFALPTRKSILKEFGQKPQYAPFVAGAASATVWQAGERLPKIFTSFNNQFISVMLGQQSLQDAMMKAQREANKDCMNP